MDQDAELSELVEIFRSEALELVQNIGEAVLKLEKCTDQEERHQVAVLAFRHAHNIKGGAATFGLGRLEKTVHALEDVLGALRDGTAEPTAELTDKIFTALDAVKNLAKSSQPGVDQLEQSDLSILEMLREALAKKKAPGLPRGKKPPASKTRDPAKKTGPNDGEEVAAEEDRDAAFVRISREKLEMLLGKLGEFVEVKIRMEDLTRCVKEVEEELARLERPDLKLPRQPLLRLVRGMEQDIQYLNKLLGEMDEEFKDLRMVPVSNIFPVLRRALRDVCRQRGLEVDLVLGGGEYQLDRKIVEEIKTPLIHILRNAVDHGIEKPAERKAQGKNPGGRVEIRVSHRGNRIRFEVSDDGRGIDYQKVHRRAVELGGFAASADQPTAEELQRLIFLSGLSTADSTDTVSGRGVGLDAVKRTVEKLKGTMAVESEPGRGTTFQIDFPLTLASETGLVVLTGTERFVIPQTAVKRVVTFKSSDVSLTGQVFNLWFENRNVPLARLEPSLRLTQFSPSEDQGHQLAVILGLAEATAAVVVDQIEAEMEIVVRNLGSFFKRLQNISGLTITAAGDVYFVLNPSDLLRTITRYQLTPESRRGASPAPGLDSAGRRGKVVLVVDDSVTSRVVNQKLLSASGYRVITANDGQHALEILRNQHCDLVLTDIQMPRLDGYQLTRRIKQDPELSQLPVVLLTAFDQPSDQEQGVEAGADAYLLKRQLSQAQLTDVIDQLI